MISHNEVITLTLWIQKNHGRFTEKGMNLPKFLELARKECKMEKSISKFTFRTITKSLGLNLVAPKKASKSYRNSVPNLYGRRIAGVLHQIVENQKVIAKNTGCVLPFDIDSEPFRRIANRTLTVYDYTLLSEDEKVLDTPDLYEGDAIEPTEEAPKDPGSFPF